jgi:hypothetical protein
MESELDQLRAELAACWLEIETLQRRRQRDAEWMGQSRTQIIALILALEAINEDRPIGKEVDRILEAARKTSKWL